jgi:hypothetical protein
MLRPLTRALLLAATGWVRHDTIIDTVGAFEKGGHACLSARKVLADLLAGELQRL